MVSQSKSNSNFSSEYYHRLKNGASISQVNPYTWVISGYEDACYFLNNPNCLHWGEDLAVSANLPSLEQAIAATLHNLGPGVQFPYRKQVMHRLAARSLRLDEEKMSVDAERMIQSLKSKNEMDFIADFAHPFTFGIISRIIGFHDAQCEAVSEIVANIEGGYLSLIDYKNRSLTPEGESFVGHLRELIEEKKENSGNDLCSALLETSNDEADQEQFLISMLTLLFYAGHQNMMNFLGLAILSMHEQPRVLDTFRSDPSVLNKSIDELIRYDSPLQYIIVVAKDDFIYKDHKIKAGNQLMVAVGVANRDAAFVDNADKIIPRRQPKHLGFGVGAFRCIGARLAHLESFLGLNTWLQHTVSYTPILEDVRWRTVPMVQRGPGYLPVRVQWKQ